MLKVFIDLLPGTPHIPLLYPNLGRPEKEGRMEFLNEAFDDLTEPFVGIVEDPAKADYVLLPHNFPLVKEQGAYLQKITDRAYDHGKKIVVFWHGDSCAEVPIPNSIVFRTSQYGYMKRANEIMMPPYTPDLLRGRKMQLRFKGTMPVVGFCGWSRYKNLKNMAGTRLKNALIDWQRITKRKLSLVVHKKGLTFRIKAIKALKSSKIVDTNFILRGSYSGSPSTIKIDPKKGREEYIQNILGSDFPLAIKGDGNYSYRFYEALSLGRVPLFVNTDCILPLSDILDYSEFTLTVDYKDISRLDKIVREFFDAMSEEQFIAMQRKAREAYGKYLSVGSFLRYVVGEIL